MARARSFARRAVGRIKQDGGVSLLTAAAMALFVLAVYILVVVGGTTLFVGRATPSLGLSVLATAIVAIAFEPVRGGVNRVIARALHQDRLSPYQVLARFPGTVTGTYPAQDLPLRVARVLAEGTGTARAEVWLAVHGRLERAATWPPDAAAPTGPSDVSDRPTIPVSSCVAAVPAPASGVDRPGGGPTVVVEGPRHSLAVRERGELLGALTVVVHDGQYLTPVEERLFAGLAAQSGLMLRVAGLRAELERELAELEHRTAELRRARRDLLTRQDAERQRLERNIHDGAQQEVLALLVNLRLAQTLLTRSPARANALLEEQAAAAGATISTLTALSRGLFPRLLTEAGPVAALGAAVASGPIPVELRSTDLPRLEAEQEAALYFCALEAVQNATKHSGATRITIDIRRAGPADPVVLTVTDDGRGFDHEPAGGGLSNIRDRIESVHGTVTISSSPARGTTIRAHLPGTPRPGRAEDGPERVPALSLAPAPPGVR